MKHLLNNLTEQEKTAIRKQHTGGMKVMTEKFSKLTNSKLGDSKPFVNEQLVDQKSNTGKSNPKSDYIASVDRSKLTPQESQEYYKQFPCLGAKTVRFQNGMAITIQGGKVLLPKEGDYYDKSVQQVRKGANQGLVGQVQGGGVYFCMSEYPDVLLMTSN
jgi:hypothetical protein